MTAEWLDYRFRMPRDVVRAGTNVLVVAFDRAPNFRKVRGYGPKELRAAAVASLTFHRGP